MEYENTTELANREEACQKVKQIAKVIEKIKINNYLKLGGISEEDRKAFYEMVDKDVELITERYEKLFSSFFVKIFMKLLYFKSKVFKTFSKISKQVGEKYEMFGTETIETIKSFPEKKERRFSVKVNSYTRLLLCL